MKRSLPGWIVGLALLGGIVWAGMLAGSHLAGAAGVIDRFETVLLDLRIAVTGHRPPPRDVVIVAIDDRTVEMAGQYPLPRSRLATLVGTIAEAGARALALDILLSGESDSTEDVPLARTFNAIPTVIAAAGHRGGMQSSASFVPVIDDVLSPAPSIVEFASIGMSNIVTDGGGTPRHIPLLFLTPDGLQPSFSLRALSLYLDETPSVTETGLRLGERTQALDLGWHAILNYYGPGGTIPTVSAARLLESDPGAIAELADRLVVLGVTSTAIGERFSSPFDPVMPGVEVQATGIANLLDGSALIRDSTTRIVDGVAALAITLLGLLAVVVLPLAPASIFYLLLLAGWLAVATVFFGQGHWLNGALPLAASLPPVTALMIGRQISDRWQARRLLQAQEALSRFQSPLLARCIAEDPAFLLTPKEQKAVTLFIDLSGYTSLCEQVSAAQTRDFLKEFHTIVVNVVNAEDGVVLDFMGDGAMICFGIPEAGRLDPIRAYRCAFSLEEAISAWLGRSGMNAWISRVRVGAHYGPVVLSRLGHDSQQQITATGDCVNVASRLLEVSKAYQASVVISSELIHAVEEATDRPIDVPRLETVAIRGRQRDLRVGLWNACESAANLQVLQQMSREFVTGRR